MIRLLRSTITLCTSLKNDFGAEKNEACHVPFCLHLVRLKEWQFHRHRHYPTNDIRIEDGSSVD